MTPLAAFVDFAQATPTPIAVVAALVLLCGVCAACCVGGGGR